MAKIIPFPAKLIPPRPVILADKSDFQRLLDRLVMATASSARAQGFLIGTTFSGILHLIIQYLMR